MTGLRVPPGRAGRVWLVRRLGTAERGAEVLDRKLRLLRHEQERLHLLTVRTQDEWVRRCAEAEEWLLRAAMIGGQRGLRLVDPEQRAEATVSWRTVMGVRYPADVSCRVPEASVGLPRPSNASLVHAQAAFAAALVAAARHAAALEGMRRVDAEAVATRLRLRALNDRVIPRLRAMSHVLGLELEQAEHEDAVRRRWAAGRVPSREVAG